MNAKLVRIVNGKQVYYDIKTGRKDVFTTWINNDPKAMIALFILGLLGAGITG